MALKQLLTNLEEGKTAGVVDSYPNHAQFNNGGSTLGNSTSLFDNFTWNQRKLKFGEGNAYDRPRQGFSREPFMGKNQEIPDLDKGASRFLGFIDSFSDGFIRGGITTAVSRSAKDVARLSKFFLSQRGIGFLTQQLALQAAQPDILAGKAGGEIGKFISLTTGADLNNNRTFNVGLNILGQAAVNFTGVHLNRSGLSPIWQDSQTYAKLAVEIGNNIGTIKGDKLATKSDFGIGGSDRGNRLLTLYNGRMTGVIPEAAFEKEQRERKTKFGQGLQNIGNKAKDFGEKASKKIKDLTGESNNAILYEYDKGPGSIYGLGKTTIYRYQNSAIPIKYATDGVDSFKKEYPLIVDINGYNVTRTDSISEIRAGKSEMHQRLKNSFGEDRPFDAYRENRVNTGTPGTIFIKSEKYDYLEPGTIDKINALDIHDNSVPLEFQRDLIKFYFDVYEGGTFSGRIQFRAFLEGFNDNYSGNWNKFNYAGRGEPFYTYDNFDRAIGFSFKVAAQTRHEMRPLFRKLNYLVSTTAPTYKSGRMRGTFVKVTIGSMIRSIPGFFSSISLSWQKDYPWEIAMDSPEGGLDKKMMELPHVLDVQCNFTPVHNFIPKTSIQSSPFLLPQGTNWLKQGVATEADRNYLPSGFTETFYDKGGKFQGGGIDPNTPINVTEIDTDDSYLDEEEEEVYTNGQLAGVQGPVPESEQGTGGYSPFIN